MDDREKRYLENFVWPISVCCLLVAFIVGILLAIRC